MKYPSLAAACMVLSLCNVANADNPKTTSTALNEVSVVSTASGFEQNIIDAAASITAISRDELDKQSYTDVYDAVKNIPGLFVTGGGGQQDISVRGMSSSYTLFMIDGRPVSAGRSVNSNGTDGGKMIALPPLAMIERIEVIRGPMSSLYGSDAMGGVINIITRKATSTWHGTVGTEYTHSLSSVSSNSQKMDLYAGGALVPDLLGMQVNASWAGTDESTFEGGDKSGESTPESRNKKAGVKFLYTPNASNEFSLDYDAATREFSHTPGMSVPLANNPSHSRFDKEMYGVAHKGKYGDWQTSTYVQHDISDNAYSTKSGKTKREYQTIANTEATWFQDYMALTLGGQYKIENFTDETNAMLTSNISGAVRQVERWIAAAFAEAEWYITDRYSVTTGLRYNDDELFGSHLSPRLYMVYHTTDSLTLKGGVSTGYKQPSLTSATPGFGRGTGGGGSPAPHPRALIIGNEDLKPETSVNYEVGYVYDKVDWGFNMSTMLFLTQFKDKIAEDRYCESPAGDRADPSTWVCPFGGNNYLFLSTQKNIDDAELRGLEWSFSKRIVESVAVNGSYTYIHSEQKTGEFKGEPLNKQPRNMINVMVDWDINDRLSSWAQYNFRDKTSDYLSRTSMETGTPGYVFIDVGVNYKLTPDVKVKAGVYNVADREVTNENFGVVLDGRRFNLGMTVNF